MGIDSEAVVAVAEGTHSFAEFDWMDALSAKRTCDAAAAAAAANAHGIGSNLNGAVEIGLCSLAAAVANGVAAEVPDESDFDV